MQNDTNDFTKRTAAQIKAVLKSHKIEATVQNMGDGRTFSLELINSLKNLLALKKAGFSVVNGTMGEPTILIKAF
jgi:hypothetical protein